ncbi:hypothetical protein N7490_008429 [Penicillium lividum]|nr:hypothetical protein N7490_008429 [Penicillium lividum]
MASSNIAKRARANTAGDIHLQTNETSDETPANEILVPLPEEIRNLDIYEISHLLHEAAKRHPDVSALVEASIQQERLNRVIDFAPSIQSVWAKLNIQNRSMSATTQRSIAFDVAGAVSSTISHISEQCAEYPTDRNRFNGLAALRKIGKIIGLSSNTVLGLEVLKQFESDPCLENAMHDIVYEMSTQEREAVTKTPLWEKLGELEELEKDGRCIFRGIAEVLNTLMFVKKVESDGRGYYNPYVDCKDPADEENDEDEGDEDEDEYGRTGDEHDIC